MMFSLEQLLFAIANDQRSKEETIKKILPMLKETYDSEKRNRNALKVCKYLIKSFLEISTKIFFLGIWSEFSGKDS